jgi:hypothetical protein
MKLLQMAEPVDIQELVYLSVCHGQQLASQVKAER